MKEKELVENVKKDNNITSDITGILDIIICLLLFISSIYKGAFYKSDFLFPNVVISILGVVYLVYKIIKEIMSKKDFRPRSKVKLLLDFCMLLLPFMYLLPIIFKTYVSLPDSIFEMFRYVNMTIIYFIARNSKNHHVYFNVFILISVIQMILGIDQITTRNFESFLNDLSTGYLPDIERLSGTLQYANITGIVIGIGVICCFNKITEIIKQENKIKYIELLGSIFIILLGISCVILTESRIATVTILGILLLDGIFNYICITRKTGAFKIALTVYSFLCSGIVEKYVSSNSGLKIYACILLCSLIFMLAYIVLNIIYYMFEDKIKKIKNSVKHINIINISGLIFMFVILAILIATPKNIVIENKGEVATFSKSVYDFKEGKNKVQFEIDSLKEDTRFTVYINALGEDYIVRNLGKYNYYDNTSGIFKGDIDIPEKTRKLTVDIEVQKGNLEFKDFNINNKNVSLSYLFIPNEIMDKLHDTFYGVYGDELRVAYAKDTFKLLKSSPLIGVGGEGFKHTYGSVQETGYISSEAHSAILQSLVEVGIIGTLVLIGILTISLYIVIKMVMRIRKMPFKDKNDVIQIISIYIALLSVVIFDLAFSYAFMIFLFGIFVAILLKQYLYIVSKCEDTTKEKNSIDWSYIKIVILSLCAVCLSCVTYFSVNSYRASLIKVPNKGEDLKASEVAENIAYLEMKNSQDKFDMDYMKDLNEEYSKYKTKLNEAIINTTNNKKLKDELKEEHTKLIVSIKNNADTMLEYEYYDKFVLRDVSDVYINNYINFADIYKEQFSNTEVAYAFYLNYVIKLTDRIIELNPYSKKANEIYIEMCNEYIEKLESDNIYIQSDAIKQSVEEFRKRI